VKQLEDEEKTNQSKVDYIDAKVDAYSESLIDETIINQYLDIANQNIVELQTVLVHEKLTTKPDLSKFQVLEDNINAKRTEFTRAKTKRELLHDQYRRAESKIKPFDGQRRTCLSCGSKLDNVSGEAERNHLQACEVAKNELASLKVQIDACDEALSKESQVNELAIKLRDKKKEESREYELASSRAADIQSKLLLKQREVKEYTLKLQNNSELQNKIKVLTGSKAEALNKKANFLKEIDLYKTVSAMYSPTGAQAYILDSVVESFNERVVAYVSLLWPNLTYELQSYKENVDGGLSAKFSERLIMDGKPISIGSLSGGEFRALSLCVDFALVDVMERQFGISMSPIVLDEPFDGLDGTGRELIVSLLEEIAEARQVVVIDHTSEIKSMFSKVLSVEKQNGISTVKLET
jgi:DNA repair exonuclease SbcCD ATPase subunit